VVAVALAGALILGRLAVGIEGAGKSVQSTTSVLPAAAWTAETGYYGRGNHTLECDSDAPGNVQINGPQVRLRATRSAPTTCSGAPEPLIYNGARVTTNSSAQIAYGDIKVRAKVDTRPGMWSSIWLLGADYPQVGWPRCGEIDIAEVTGRAPGIAYSTVHAATNEGQPFSITGQSLQGVDLGMAYHTYELRWTASSLTFLLDGVPYRTITKSAVEAQGAWPFSRPSNLILSLAVGGAWPGNPGKTSVPSSMRVSSVQVTSDPTASRG
jgi:beta-glucanase (GH16 family)